MGAKDGMQSVDLRCVGLAHWPARSRWTDGWTGRTDGKLPRRTASDSLLPEGEDDQLIGLASLPSPVKVDRMAKAVSSSASLKQDVPLFIAYVSLVVLALLPIYFGSYQSLRTPKSVLDARKAAKKGKSGKKTTETDDEDNEDEEQEAQTETLTSADAYLFPVIGSVVLFSLYLVFKYLDRTWVDRILSVYFALVGSAAVYKVALSLTEGIVGTASWKKFLQYKIHVTHTLTDKELEAERKARAGEATKEGKDGEETADEKPQRTRSEYDQTP